MPKFDALSYYEVLGVTPDASTELIKRQYYDRAKYWHPDHNKQPQAQNMFQQVSSAYAVLQNLHDRLIYDLLSCVYDTENFPLMGSLKIYKNQADKEDKALRVLKQQHVLRGKTTQTKDICNIREASGMVFTTALNNWLKGWWGKDGWQKTFKALKANLHSIYADDTDNLQLLIHNAVAYEQEQNSEMAWIYAMQALKMANPQSKLAELLNHFVQMLNYIPTQKINIPYWNAKILRNQQIILPLSVTLIAALAIFGGLLHSGIISFNQANVGRYYEERVFADGKRMASDTIVSKILKTDSTPYSTEYLMHFNEDCIIYHGPDTQYSEMLTAQKGQTVRVSGYTGDKQWSQIVLDNGEMGYTLSKCLNKGIGNPVPFGSKVYKGSKK